MTTSEMTERSLSDIVRALREARDTEEAIDRELDRQDEQHTAVQLAHTHAPEPTERYRPEPVAPDMFAYHLRMALIELENFLLEKNRMYGNSALQPIRVFSRADPISQLDVRIDDKLSRMKHRQHDDTEDTERDTLGYLILKDVYRRMRG